MLADSWTCRLISLTDDDISSVAEATDWTLADALFRNTQLRQRSRPFADLRTSPTFMGLSLRHRSPLSVVHRLKPC
jgi:hypothetical protein